jgi:hypothetical protein
MTRTLDVPADVVTAVLNHRLLGPKANENYIQALPVRRMREALETWAKHIDEIVARVPPQQPEWKPPPVPPSRRRAVRWRRTSHS